MDREEVGAWASPCVGPPPILNIFHVEVNDLSAAQKKRASMLKNRIRAEQARLLRLKEAKLKEGNTQQQKQQQPKSQHRKEKEQQKEHKPQEEPDQQKQQKEHQSHQTQHPQPQLQQIQLTAPLTGFEVHWADDLQNRVRMLVAREWHVPRAFSLMIEAISIRRQLHPERIKPQEVKAAAKAGQIYRRGFDKQGHPLIYLRPALNDEIIDGDACINLLIYTLERACQSQNRHCGASVGLCFLMDYNGYSNANQPSLATALRFIQIFQCIYAEQLAAAYIVDTPWYFTTFWNCITPFLPARTAAKIKFLSTSKPDEVKQIFDAIHPKYVEPWVPGGQATSKYDHEIYWAEEAKQFETYMKFLQTEFFKKSMAQRLAENAAFSAALARGLSIEQAMKVAHDASADKSPTGAADDSATAETQDGEEDADDTDDPDTPESLEDEQRRLMLQEAIQKEQQPPKGPMHPSENEVSCK